MTIKILISSSKSMIYNPDKHTSDINLTNPIYSNEATEINKSLKELNVSDIQRIMKLSLNLANKTKIDIDEFTDEFSGYPAISYFSGDIYKGLRKIKWQKQDYIYATENLAIISGLYGYLRPVDIIKKYRLEMGYKLKVKNKENLTNYWHNRISNQLESADVIFNLLSFEYSKAILPLKNNPLIIHPYFFNKQSNGEMKFITRETKIARGLMASWLIKNQIKTIDEMQNFNLDGYRYEDDYLNQKTNPIFSKKSVIKR